MWLMTTTIDLPLPDEFLGNLFRTGSPANVLGFSDPLFDRRIDEAGAPAPRQTSLREYSQAESQLCAAMPAVPLWTGGEPVDVQPGAGKGHRGGAYLDSLGTPLLRHAGRGAADALGR